MRILDCKEGNCKKLNEGAPIILDYLCEECKEHFKKVKSSLDKLGIQYKIDPQIVRGLDYYTKTVFEFVSEEEDYTVLAGGRYDELVKELGGVQTSALGFAMGLERIIEIYENNNIKPETPEIYIATLGEEAEEFARKLVHELRKNGTYAETDIMGKGLGAQFKYADKIGAKYVITIGEDELQTKQAELKNMETGEVKAIDLGTFPNEE